jgi:UBX domain-containing protein 1
MNENRQSQSSGGGIRGFSDIAQKDQDDDRESYYAGGSEKSGVQIQDPRKKPEKSAELVQQVFDNAKKYVAT